MNKEEAFGTVLKKLRLYKGMTQAELSKASGIYQAQLSHYENGTHSPSPENVMKLLTILDAPQEYFDFFYQKKAEETLAKNIRMFRKINRITQTELAKAVGVTQAQISSYEKGMHKPAPKHLSHLAAYFGVDIERLLNEDIFEPQSQSTSEMDYDWEMAEKVEEESSYLSSCTPPPEDHPEELLCKKFQFLTKANQEIVFEFMDFLLSIQA